MEFFEKRTIFGAERGVRTTIQCDDRGGHDFLLLSFEGGLPIAEIESCLDFLVGKIKKQIQNHCGGK